MVIAFIRKAMLVSLQMLKPGGKLDILYIESRDRKIVYLCPNVLLRGK